MTKTERAWYWLHAHATAVNVADAAFCRVHVAGEYVGEPLSNQTADRRLAEYDTQAAETAARNLHRANSASTERRPTAHAPDTRLAGPAGHALLVSMTESLASPHASR